MTTATSRLARLDCCAVSDALDQLVLRNTFMAGSVVYIDASGLLI